MRQKADGLNRLFKPFSRHLIQQHRKKNRHYQIENDFSNGNDEGIPENFKSIRKHKHIFKIIQTDPLGFEKPENRLKVFKSHDITEKRQYCIGKQHNYSGKKHQMHRPCIF